MAKTLYMLGAGVNMVVRHQKRGIHPPLARTFFQQLHYGLSADELASLQEKNHELYEYIYQRWQLSFDDLSVKSFDLEECFTQLEREESSASRRQEVAGALTDTWVIKGQLIGLLAKLLNEISLNQPPEAPGLRPLARRVLDEEAVVVTFNYDTLLEQAMIQEAAGGWDPLRAYTVCFDHLQSRDGELLEKFRLAYFQSQGHTPPFLKMHGSLNWFRIAFGSGEPEKDEHGMLVHGHRGLGQTVVRPADNQIMESTTGHTFVVSDGTLLEQLIITPVLNKEVDKKPFTQIWQRAESEMRTCSKLVVCGYSFPPTDCATRQLLQKAFAHSPPDELVVINPDMRVVHLVKNLCRFKGCVSVCEDLQEYF